MFVDDPKSLVSTKWLAEHLNDPNLRVLDASRNWDDFTLDARAEFEAAHIPNARYFDIDDVADHRSDLPHMAPPVEKFLSRVRAMGVGDGHQVVVYDSAGLFSAARVWWLFRLMGHETIAVLDGGLPKWQADGYAVNDIAPIIRDRHMYAYFQPHLVKDVTQVAAASKLGDFQIVDARSAGRFHGTEPEIHEGLRGGHIPNSKNVHYESLLNVDGTLKDNAKLKAVFAAAGVDLNKPVIATCGSGVTANIVTLALTRLGHTDHSIYDGSWCEWGMPSDLKVVKE